MRRPVVTLLAAGVAAMACAGGPSTDSRAPTSVASSCAVSDGDRRFIERVIAAWTRTEQDVLGLEPAGLPAMFFAGKECVYRLTSERPPGIAGQAWPPNGVELPSGARLAPGRYGFSALGSDGKPFWVLSLMDLWQDHPVVGQMPDAVDHVVGVGLHELVHTRQLAVLERSLLFVLDGKPIESLDDSIVQTTMAGDAAYASLQERSSNAFWQAVLASGDDRVRAIREGLALVGERRALLTGERAYLAEIEPLFLTVEGVAEWARAEMLLDGTWSADGLSTLRSQNRHSWMLDEGLALMVLVSQLVPDWRAQVLASPPADLHRLLAQAIN